MMMMVVLVLKEALKKEKDGVSKKVVYNLSSSFLIQNCANWASSSSSSSSGLPFQLAQ